MTKEKAYELVIALIASGRLPVPTFEVQNQEQWAKDVRETIDKYVRLFTTH